MKPNTENWNFRDKVEHYSDGQRLPYPGLNPATDDLEFTLFPNLSKHERNGGVTSQSLDVEDQVNDMRCNRRFFRSGSRANSEMSMDKGSLAELFSLMEKGKST